MSDIFLSFPYPPVCLIKTRHSDRYSARPCDCLPNHVHLIQMLLLSSSVHTQPHQRTTAVAACKYAPAILTCLVTTRHMPASQRQTTRKQAPILSFTSGLLVAYSASLSDCFAFLTVSIKLRILTFSLVVCPPVSDCCSNPPVPTFNHFSLPRFVHL